MRMRFALVTLAGVLVALGLLLPLALRRRPVLLHVFGDASCLCGDFHAEVSGLVVRNPFRDRSPEMAADAFFQEIRRGSCPSETAEEVCRYALDGHAVSEWKIVNRRDEAERSTLFFKLTKNGEPNPRFRLAGEGAVGVSRSSGTWVVDYYSSYF